MKSLLFKGCECDTFLSILEIYFSGKCTKDELLIGIKQLVLIKYRYMLIEAGTGKATELLQRSY